MSIQIKSGVTITGGVTLFAPPPVVNFSASPTTGLLPLSVAFTDLSTGPVSWVEYQTGDGTFLYNQNIVYSYRIPGTYSVTLTAYDINDNVLGIKTQTNYITVLPSYLGIWNADTNTPPLTNGTGDIGTQYQVATAGSMNLGAGVVTYAVGDFIKYNGSVWTVIPANTAGAATFFLGAYNPTMNTPALADGTGVAGAQYRVSIAGLANLGSGDIPLSTGDYLTYNGTIWQKLPAYPHGPGIPMVVNVTVPAGAVMVSTGGDFPQMTIDWGDGGFDTWSLNANPTHTYASGGSYIVTITSNGSIITTPDSSRDFAGFKDPLTDQAGDLNSIITSISSFGELGITKLYLNNAVNLTSVPAYLPSSITDLEYAFGNCTNLNDSNISLWDTSNVTNTAAMFIQASSFNQDISIWNVSNVTTMVYMFNNALSFNQDISTWNVATNMLTYPTDFATNSMLDPLNHPENHAKLPQVWSTTWPA